jgi:hypothetical protein
MGYSDRVVLASRTEDRSVMHRILLMEMERDKNNAKIVKGFTLLRYDLRMYERFLNLKLRRPVKNKLRGQYSCRNHR